MGDGVFSYLPMFGFFFWTIGWERRDSVNKLSLSLYHNTFITLHHLPFPVQPRFYNRISYYHTRLGELPQYGIQSVITVYTVLSTITINCYDTTITITFAQEPPDDPVSWCITRPVNFLLL